jgi:hypothetical protein
VNVALGPDPEPGVKVAIPLHVGVPFVAVSGPV